MTVAIRLRFSWLLLLKSINIDRPGWAAESWSNLKYQKVGAGTYKIKGTYRNGGSLTKKNSHMKLMKKNGKVTYKNSGPAVTRTWVGSTNSFKIEDISSTKNGSLARLSGPVNRFFRAIDSRCDAVDGPLFLGKDHRTYKRGEFYTWLKQN